MTIDPRDRERSAQSEAFEEEALEVECEVLEEEIPEGEILQEEVLGETIRLQKQAVEITPEQPDRPEELPRENSDEPDNVDRSVSRISDGSESGNGVADAVASASTATTGNSSAIGLANYYTTMIQISSQAAQNAIDLQKNLTVEHRTRTSQQLQLIFNKVRPPVPNRGKSAKLRRPRVASNQDTLAFVIQALENDRQ